MDPLLDNLVKELVGKHRCHTVILYGSRARGDFTEHSDYDLMGVRAAGKSYRIARKQSGSYIDIFVYTEKELKKPGEEHLYMSGARLLYDRKGFGATFLRKLKNAAKKKYKPLPADEIQVRKVWLHKMLDRARLGDIEGNYRRIWLIEALLYEYFNIRKKRFSGSKQSFAWLKNNDPVTYKLFDRVLAHPDNLRVIERLVQRVSGRRRP